MTDLRTWISQQIDKAEAVARAATPGPWITPDHDDQIGMLEVRTAHEADIMIGYVADVATADAHHIALNDPAAVLRRCTADRKILARHNVDIRRADDRLYATACDGCGTYGDCDDPVTDNLNDCPELLDLAEGLGLTAAQLAQLDRPQPPERKLYPGVTGNVISDSIASLYASIGPRTPMAEVPPGLRGPNWKARP